MALEKEVVLVKFIQFIAADWSRKTGVKGQKRSYTDPDDLSRHYCDGFGNETVVTPKMAIASCVTEDGKHFKTDLRQNVKHAYRDKTEKERSNLIKALIRSIIRTGGHIDLYHNDSSNLGWIPDKDVIARCESEKILANYEDFGEEQGIWS